MKNEVLRLFSVSETITGLISIAHALVIGDTSPEKAAFELIKIVKEMHHEETVLFDNCLKLSSEEGAETDAR